MNITTDCGMKCPKCEQPATLVTNVWRIGERGELCKRRRECVHCGEKFSTVMDATQCPDCGNGEARVHKTRTLRKSNKVRRIYICARCGRHYVRVEELFIEEETPATSRGKRLVVDDDDDEEDDDGYGKKPF